MTISRNQTVSSGREIIRSASVCAPDRAQNIKSAPSSMTLVFEKVGETVPAETGSVFGQLRTAKLSIRYTHSSPVSTTNSRHLFEPITVDSANAIFLRW